MVRDATERVEHDAAIDADAQHRMRFGVYFYSEPQREVTGETPTAKPAAPRLRTPIKRRSS
jgi:hypothetical protein